MKHVLYCLIILLNIIGAAGAQNLVPNPSFEELYICPQSFSTPRENFRLPGWISPSRGTPDHFHSCSWYEADVPVNWAGNSLAKTGNGYVGIYLWRGPNYQNNYREYIQCELAEPLIRDNRYKIEFYFKLASNAVYAVDRIGLLLTVEQISLKTDQVIKRTPTLSVEKDSSVTRETGSWEHAVMEYTAEGGERYVTIGNFFDNQSTRYTKFPSRAGRNFMLANASYYYIDDVSVVPLDIIDQQLVPETFELNKTYILQNIQFAFDSYRLLDTSFPELEKVVAYLKANPTVTAIISGHTDFIGSEEYNQVLSENRAAEVARYFISSGIAESRLTPVGYGKSMPLNTALTDEARKLNRRVEIRFSEK